jgi:quinoprotein glucose dehydrogenase
MSRIARPSLVIVVLGSALGAAATAPVLAAAGTPAGVEIPAGTTLQLAATAKEQHLESPTALAFDESGRIFITETPRLGHGVEDDRKHLDWYLADLAARKTSERLALYEKWKAQVPHSYLTEKSERVRCLADGDGDGVFEKSTVFADGFNDPLDGAIGGVLAHQGGVYVACIPNLWLLRDANGDGVADDRKTLQDGFGVRVSLAGHDLRGFTLGPDGRLYGTLGDRGLNLTTKEGKTYQYPNEGCAFRIEADGSGFEVFHTGLRNPQGLVFDAFGNAFTVEASSGLGDAPRLIYLVDGGDSGWQMEHQTLHDFHRQIGLTELPPNRWIDEHMWELRHPLQPAYILPPAAHLTVNPAGLASHPGTGFLEAEAGRFLVCDQGGDAAHSGIGSFEVKPEGAGMQLTDFRQLLRGIAATAAAYAWDGRLFIIDGGNEQIFSLNAAAGTWHPSEAAETVKLIREGFAQRDSAELAKLLKHPDSRVRLRAQIALTRQADALARFSAAIASGDVMERVHGVWGIGILARRGSGVPVPGNTEFGDVPDNKVRLAAGQLLAGLLKHPDAEVRAQAARAIGDARNQFVQPRDLSAPRGLPTQGTLVTAEGLPLAALLFDQSPRVRYFAAVSIGKLKALGFYSSICDFLKANDNRDPYLRHAGAFALQHIATNSLMLSGLERHPSPAVRLGATIALRRMRDPAVATFIHDPDPQVADEAIRAVTDLSLDSVRIPLSRLLDNLAARPWQPFMLRRLIHNAFRLGTAKDAARLLKLVGDPAIPVEIQQESLRLLALWVTPPAVDQLTGHWRPLAARDPATIKPALNTALPRLLQQDGFIRTAALELGKQYQLETPAAALPSTPKVPATDKP